MSKSKSNQEYNDFWNDCLNDNDNYYYNPILNNKKKSQNKKY